MLMRKILAVALAALLITGFAGGCTKKLATAPYIPSEYYNCIELPAVELVHQYFSGYGEIWRPIEQYNDKVFVFKNIVVEYWTIRDVDKGWIWVDLIKCRLADKNAMANYKIGDRIDVVGYNLGPEDIKTTGLTFKDCYVLPAGSIMLPAEGNGPFTGGY